MDACGCLSWTDRPCNPHTPAPDEGPSRGVPGLFRRTRPFAVAGLGFTGSTTSAKRSIRGRHEAVRVMEGVRARRGAAVEAATAACWPSRARWL